MLSQQTDLQCSHPVSGGVVITGCSSILFGKIKLWIGESLSWSSRLDVCGGPRIRLRATWAPSSSQSAIWWINVFLYDIFLYQARCVFLVLADATLIYCCVSSIWKARNTLSLLWNITVTKKCRVVYIHNTSIFFFVVKIKSQIYEEGILNKNFKLWS